MERKEVYRLIDGERDYQDSRWDNHAETRAGKSDTLDENKSVAEWLNYLEFHLNEAKHAVYALEPKKATASIRKIAALAVRAMEIHGAPERKLK
jgi:D-aminopeptidase